MSEKGYSVTKLWSTGCIIYKMFGLFCLTQTPWEALDLMKCCFLLVRVCDDLLVGSAHTECAASSDTGHHGIVFSQSPQSTNEKTKAPRNKLICPKRESQLGGLRMELQILKPSLVLSTSSRWAMPFLPCTRLSFYAIHDMQEIEFFIIILIRCHKTGNSHLNPNFLS
jgi:hypothetical protein